VATEVHSAVGILFAPASDEVKAWLKERAYKKFQYLNDFLLKDTPFLLGDKPYSLDYYLNIILSWRSFLGLDLSNYPNLAAYADRVVALENVVAAHARMNTSPTHITAWIIYFTVELLRIIASKYYSTSSVAWRGP